MRVLQSLGDLVGFEGCVCVPTMGALHAGHEALIRHGAELARETDARAGCVVTIFVNPTQFNDPKDFQRYPRTLEGDLPICERAGATAVFAPTSDVIYPSNAKIHVPPLPQVATQPGLEDAHRPGHFAGVCQVVLRLFDLVRPSCAVFGEKDWQQLAVIRAMTLEEGLGIDIVGHPTIREPDGLAMSSRNRFLSATERTAALSISQALREIADLTDHKVAEQHMRQRIAKAGLEVEYAVVRDAASLLPITFTPDSRPRRALIAARAGATRLIDNAAWPGGW